MADWATPQERRAFGRSRRKQLPRVDLARWSAKDRLHDPLALLRMSMRGRLPALVTLKYERMMASPFGYFRGAAPVMAADLALLPRTGLLSQLCGDAHVLNLGAYAANDGRLLFDINDFDETTRGPFEWETRRMAASLVLAGRQAGARKSGCRDAVRMFAASYRKAVCMFSTLPVLEVARYQVHRLQRIQPVSKALLQAERSTPMHTLDKLTEAASGHPHRIFCTVPPTLERFTGAKARAVLAGLTDYRASLLPERRHFLDQYRPLDVAMKVVGTGSVGLRCYVVYLEGNGEKDPLFLQIKEEVASAYAAYLPAPLHGEPRHNGERVAEGQRAMQLLSDPMLGWTTIAARQYVVRQLNDHKGTIDLAVLAGDGLQQYAEVCGELLARGHCRSGDACALAGYLGNSSKMEEALADFAVAYADQTEKDWQQLCKAKGGQDCQVAINRAMNEKRGGRIDGILDDATSPAHFFAGTKPLALTFPIFSNRKETMPNSKLALPSALMSAVLLCCAPWMPAQKTTDNAPPPRVSGLELSFVNPTADPCVDFEAYACGNFSKLHPTPEDRSGYGSGAMLYDYNTYLLHTMLEKAAAGGSSRSANAQKIGDYYAACMDEKAIDARGLKELAPEMARIAALKSKDELPALLAHFQLINVNSFLSFGQQQDFKDASKQIAVADQGGLGLPERDYYLRTGDKDEKIRQEYVEHIANTLKLAGDSDSQAAEDAKKIMALETALAKASLDITSQRDPHAIYHLMPVSEVQKLTPAFDWSVFLRDTDAPAVTEMNVTYPPFYQALNGLISSTDLATIKTYLRWQLLAATPGLVLPKAFDEESFNFNSHELRGQPVQRARWKRCVQATDNALGEALGQVYVEQEFPPASKAATLQMVHDIEGAMDQDIDTLQWMSPETKVRAKAKLTAIANKIGYPDKWRDYSTLKVERGDALGNYERAVEFENKRQLAKINQPVDRGEFGMSPPTVDAYYNPSMNDINFPAGILQPPFFDSSQPDQVNYGHVGAIVGHELTHGFDDQGRQFDPKGNLADWWTSDDGKKFDERADCEVKEYSNFVVDGDAHVNGKLTLGENTADNGGLRLAYLAFLADAKRKTIDLNAKHDGYTPTQQFFLAFAQNWCGSSRPQAERVQVQTDPHSPRQFRVNGVVQNMTEFGQAFGCKVGQPMMPKDACRVW